MDSRRRVVRAARPADDDEPNGARYIPPAMPGLNFRECVGSDEEEEFIFGRKLSANLFYGVDGVAALGAFLDARNFHARVPQAREFGHPYAMCEGGVGDPGSVRRMGRGKM